MSLLRAILLSSVVVPAALAQSTHVLPDGLAALEGNDLNGIPWGTGGGARVQFLYDSTHFTNSATPITQPILIQRLRWRANGSATATWTGGIYSQARIDISTAAVDYTAAVPGFDQNHGQDRITVYSGPVSVLAQPAAAGIPGPWYVDVILTTPFFYNPLSGRDLLLDIDLPGATWGGGTHSLCDYQQGGTARGSRVSASLTYGASVGTVAVNECAVVELTWVAASGLFPRFDATPNAGSSPLLVQFTDASWTNDPNGILLWQWDFDNDSVIDSTLQNPTHTYPACGSYTVRLAVLDATHGTQALVRTAAVVVDAIRVGFTANPLAGLAPLLVQFTDMSTGPVSAWAWDFNADNVTDSTVRHPLWAFATPGAHTVRLTVSNACFTDTLVRNNYVVVINPANLPAPPDILQYQFNEVRGQTLANTASGTTFPAQGSVNTANWMGDPGRAGFRGNEAGAGVLACSNGTGNTNLVLAGGSATITGSMTIMWWHRQVGLTPTQAYAFAGSVGGGPRIYTTNAAGFAGASLGFRGSNIGDVVGTTPIWGSPGVWQHVALVVDDVARVATWHFDGIAGGSRVFTVAHSSTFTDLRIGWGSSATTNTAFPMHFDMDDVRVYGRALSAGEIQAAMALAETPSAGQYGSSCAGPGGMPSIGTNSVPVIGNLGFAITLQNAEPSRLCGMVLGLAPRAFGTFDLSSILGPGCLLETDWFLAVFYLTGTGTAQHAIPIPNNQFLRGQHVYAQWLVAGTAGAVTRALDVNIR